MVLFNYSTKELTAKVVYYGPGLCGKTTNLHWIHEKLPIKNKGKMLSLATETDRTLFFDFLPIEIGTIRGMRTRIQLYTVPGQVFYNATRRMVLKGADCVVFVCDSQEAMLDANLESYENLRQNLEANEIDPDEIPVVFQYNKRDLPNALPIEIMNERLNSRNHPFYEAVALKGQGVEETLKGVTKLVFKSLSAKYGEGAAVAPGAATPSKAAPAAAMRAPAPPRVSAPPPLPPRAKKAPAPPPAPSPQSAEELLLEQIDFGADTAPPDVPVLEEIEEMPPPARGAVKRVESTMVSSRGEADDLRRRIAQPAAEFDMNLEEVEEQEDEVEEISLDGPGMPPFEDLPPVRSAPAARTGRAAPGDTSAIASANRGGRERLAARGGEGRGGTGGDPGLGAHRDQHRAGHPARQPEPAAQPERQDEALIAPGPGARRLDVPPSVDYPIIRISRWSPLPAGPTPCSPAWAACPTAPGSAFCTSWRSTSSGWPSSWRCSSCHSPR
jgi:signal recognition particle receptor subunit beta